MDKDSQLAMHYSKLRMVNPWRNAKQTIAIAREMTARGDRAYWYYTAGYRNQMARGTWDRDGSGAYYLDDWPSGWRVLGRVDEIEVDGYKRVDHGGWYTDGDCQDTMAGYVLQLPSRHGKTQFVPAMKHSDWDGVTLYLHDIDESLAEAVRTADRRAERAAETERDYREGYDKGRDALGAAADARDALEEAKALVADLRAVRGAAVDAGACARLRERAKGELLALWRRARKSRRLSARLRCEWGSHQGFQNSLIDGI